MFGTVLYSRRSVSSVIVLVAAGLNGELHALLTPHNRAISRLGFCELLLPLNSECILGWRPKTQDTARIASNIFSSSLKQPTNVSTARHTMLPSR